MTEQDRDKRALDALFAAARAEPARPDDALMARILADAAREQPRAAAPVRTRALPERGGWRGWLDAIGGWPAAGGMALATVAGLWIGISPPQGLSTVNGLLWGETVSVDPFPDAADLLGLLEG
jgi:hypothetical protein